MGDVFRFREGASLVTMEGLELDNDTRGWIMCLVSGAGKLTL